MVLARPHAAEYLFGAKSVAQVSVKLWPRDEPEAEAGTHYGVEALLTPRWTSSASVVEGASSMGVAYMGLLKANGAATEANTINKAPAQGVSGDASQISYARDQSNLFGVNRRQPMADPSNGSRASQAQFGAGPAAPTEVGSACPAAFTPASRFQGVCLRDAARSPTVEQRRGSTATIIVAPAVGPRQGRLSPLLSEQDPAPYARCFTQSRPVAAASEGGSVSSGCLPSRRVQVPVEAIRRL